jgi:hypothetical protein
VRADGGHAAAARGAAIYADEFSERIIVTDFEAALLAPELQVLRRPADGAVAVEVVALADDGGSFDAGVGADRGAGADGDVRSDEHERADVDVRGEAGLAADDRGGVNSRHPY